MDPRLTHLPSFFVTLLRPAKAVAAQNLVHLRVPLNVNKPQIANYMEQIYKVKVKRVDTMIYVGKTKRSRMGQVYKKSDWKKAVVEIDGTWEYPSLEEQKAMSPSSSSASTAAAKSQ